MTPTQRNDLRARIENAKLRSDDHGHDTTALREYCEMELIWAYEIAMPALLTQLEEYEAALQSCALSDQVQFIAFGKPRAKVVLAKYQGHGG